MTRLAFVDTETTGLDPDRHEIWEVALILRDELEGDDLATVSDAAGDLGVARAYGETTYVWQLPVDLSRADPTALNIGRFHERRARSTDYRVDGDHRGLFISVDRFVPEFAQLTRGAHLVGAVVSFDEERLRRLLRANGECPMWHYHLIDVENLAAGWLAGAAEIRAADWPDAIALPWASEKLSLAVGIDPAEFDRHSALGDAQWARAIYDAVTT